jgi:ABC-2 type transport system permease protein
VMGIILLALVLTLPLPITVSQIGNLDWGPVVGGYLAAILMAGAYAAIGLFVSSRTDNQIVALIMTIIVGGAFYLVGTSAVTNFFGGTVSQVLWGVGTGSRFESIQRGVIDLRDLIYYLSVIGFFLLLNTISLDSIRWSQKQVSYRRRWLTTSSLIGLNLIILNVWMFPMNGLRLDLTQNKEFTISQTTRDLLNTLQEPLLIRAYISEENHPLLKPLAPQVADMLREYEIAAGGKVTAEVVDPLKDPAIEKEANESYGIQPTPFQISGTNETSVINSYFDILIRYGDQSVVLNYQDIMEITSTTSGVQVQLRNLEYDLTRAIKKVIYGFQSVDTLLASLDQPVNLTLYVTNDTLPQDLQANVDVVNQVAQNLVDTSNGNVVYNVVDPDQPGAAMNRQTLADTYNVQPFAVSFMSDQTFYMALILQNGDQTETIYPLDQNLTTSTLNQQIDAALKRTTTGFLKNIAIVTQDLTPQQDMFGQTIQPISSYQMINQTLSDQYKIQSVDLTTGQVPPSVDALILIAPSNLSDMELYAIDQFLMRGGSLIMSASNYRADIDPYYGGLGLVPVDGGVKDLLASYGVNLSDSIVMDPQNEAFPVAVTHDVNGYQVQQIQSLDYPFFADVRPDKMNSDSLIMSNLPAVTMNWASPVEVDMDKNANNDVQVLLSSSDNSWTTTNTNIQPDFTTYPDTGFAAPQETGSYPLAVSIQGTFTSFFKGKPVPTADTTDQQDTTSDAVSPESQTPEQQGPVTTIDTSSPDARLVVFGSSTFVDDFVLRLSMQLSQDRYMNNLNMMQNAVDWSIEDVDLLNIRARGNAARVLDSLTLQQENMWEGINYGVALIVLLGVYLFWQYEKRNEKPMQLVPLKKIAKNQKRKGE